jgi:tetratricopeptide (TPR) repeat protein
MTPKVLEYELRALLRLDAGATAEAEALLRNATALEDRMPVEFGPPAIVKPSHELLGDVLLQLGRAADAQIEYERALRLAPKRALSLLGLARAADRAGDAAAARNAWNTLGQIWQSADSELPALAEVRRAVAAR